MFRRPFHSTPSPDGQAPPGKAPSVTIVSRHPKRPTPRVIAEWKPTVVSRESLENRPVSIIRRVVPPPAAASPDAETPTIKQKEWLRTAAHEIRTPLTALTLSLELLGDIVREHTLTEEQKETLRIALTNADRLQRMSSNLLQIEAATQEGEAETGAAVVHKIVRDAMDSVSLAARRRRIKLETSLGLEEIRCDGEAIGRVLVNLLSNAVKFADHNSTILLSAWGDGFNAFFSVHNHGRLIPEEFRDRIFSDFQQVEKSDATVHGGTGLGLSICKRIVERHGGRIWFTSDPGEGTRFSFSLPNAG